MPLNESHIYCMREFEGSNSNLRVGIGPDRSGMHFADSGYGSIAQIAQRGHTSRVAVGGRRGAKSGQSFACGAAAAADERSGPRGGVGRRCTGIFERCVHLHGACLVIIRWCAL